MKIRTQLKAGRIVNIRANASGVNHNETLQTRTGLKAGRINLRAAVQTTARKEDRLELLVVRAGLRAGRAARRIRL